ncbi:MAG TPA: biotin/lipoyl-binding carrier protein [Burkholderiales bacterium]|jgi:biotin carboxyl carrier protein
MLDDLRHGRDARQCAENPMLYFLSFTPLHRQRQRYGPQFSRSVMARIEVKSEITGTVWQVKSKPGDSVESGDTLIVIESMKMEIPVITEDPGVVKEILVKEKDPVAEGQVVAILEG